MSNIPDCPRCAELRGKTVKMHAVKTGPRPSAYECPSCDHAIFLGPLFGSGYPATLLTEDQIAALCGGKKAVRRLRRR